MKRKILIPLFLLGLLVTTFFFGLQVGYSNFSGSEENLPKYLDSTLPYTFIMDTNGTHYAVYNCTSWKRDYLGSNAETSIEWAINQCPHYGSIFFREGTYDIEDEIDDQNKNGIQIIGTWGTIFDVDTRSDTEHGFAISGNDNWKFYNVQFYAGYLVEKTFAGFESGTIYLSDAQGITIDHVLFKQINGYCIRIVNPSGLYVTGLTVSYNKLDRCGHNFLSGAGINDSKIVFNDLYKIGDDLDDEFIWLGARDLAVDIGCYRNTISYNDFYGGSVLINFDEYTTDTAGMVSDNTISYNKMISPVGDSGRDDPIIYINDDDNKVLFNKIFDYRTGRSDAVVGIKTNAGTPEPRIGMHIIGNYIEYWSGRGIACIQSVERFVVSLNIVLNQTSTPDNDSIFFPDTSNDYSVCTSNISGTGFDFDDTTTTNKVANNVELT